MELPYDTNTVPWCDPNTFFKWMARLNKKYWYRREIMEEGQGREMNVTKEIRELISSLLCHPLTTSKVEVKWIIESLDPPPIADHTTSSGKKADPSVPHTHIHSFPWGAGENGGRPSSTCSRNNYNERNLDMGICLFSKVEEKMDLSGRGWFITIAVHKTHVRESERPFQDCTRA